MAKIINPESLEGKYVNLREVTLDDAAFILKLRTDEKKSAFLHNERSLLKRHLPLH